MSTPLRKPIAQYHDETLWLQAKRGCLGGSDMAALWNWHPWKSAHDVWLEKMNRAPERRVTPDMRRGKRLEDVAANVFSERTGLRVERAGFRLLRPDSHIGASIDRRILNGKDLMGNIVESHPCELKVPRTRTAYVWKRKGLPDYIVLQGQVEASVWKKNKTTFGIYVPDDDDMIAFPVPVNPDVMRKVEEVAEEWWEKHIVRGIEPPMDGAPVPDLKDLPEVKGTVLYRTDEEFAEVAEQWREARELAKNADLLFELAKERVKAVCGLPGVYELENQIRFYFSEKPGKRTFDHKALAAFKPIDGLTLATELHNAFSDVISLPVLTEIIEKSRLDVERFFKTGRPFNELRGFILKPSEEE